MVTPSQTLAGMQAKKDCVQVFCEILRHAPGATIEYLTKNQELLAKLFAWCARAFLCADHTDQTYCVRIRTGVNRWKQYE